MTATEVLRCILDKRGVEWKEHKHVMPGSNEPLDVCPHFKLREDV